MVLPHPFPFDPTYGHDLARLRAVTPPPAVAGFADFWRATYAAARAVPLELERSAIASPSADHDAFIVRFTGLGGHRQGAWLLLPRDGKVSRGWVIGHGYGGREGMELVPAGVAAIMPCAPGFHLSAAPGVPDISSTHVVHGITSKDTYLIRFCVAGLWAAVTALNELCPATVGRTVYKGGSFGGGLGALAIPWDARITAGWLDVPTFGHHPLRLACPCTGSGEAVRTWHAVHPEVEQVLAFYDAAVAATFIRVPLLVTPAAFDPAVPPPGQFAVANAVPGARVRPREYGHFAWPGENAEWAMTEREWHQLLAEV